MITSSTTALARPDADSLSTEAVVSKLTAGATFGNDKTVVIKCDACVAFCSDAMFVRVRRRALKGMAVQGKIAKASASYDVVRAVRIDGKPRQKFLFGLGSLKENTSDHALVRFWVRAERRMQKHGLTEEQKRRLIDAMVRKGAPQPSSEDLERERDEQRQMSLRLRQQFPGWLKS